MKAITLWQPWATLMAIGAKTIETRPRTAWWAKNHRGPLLIHAAKSWNWDVLEELNAANRRAAGDNDWRKMLDALLGAGYNTLRQLPCGAILCSICVHSVGEIHGPAPEHGWTIELPDGALIDVPEAERPFGDYREGRLGIVSSHVTRFAVPIPFRGSQGIFNVPDELVEEALRG